MHSSNALELGDCIGMESCSFDLRTGDFVMPVASDGGGGGGRDQPWKMRRQKKEKTYPPPIPLLARTGNLPSRMPWVLKKHYTEDGRLIIVEERVKHHEYFRAHRANGRLTLQLVPLDDDIFDTHDQDKSSEQEEEEISKNVEGEAQNGSEANTGDITDCTKLSLIYKVDDPSSECKIVSSGQCNAQNMTSKKIFGEAEETLSYCVATSQSNADMGDKCVPNSCIVNMAVPSIRPVRT